MKVRDAIRVVIEETKTGYSAYSPDLSGCVAAGQTVEEIQKNMQDAINFHLEGLQFEGCHIPEPHSQSAYVEVAA